MKPIYLGKDPIGWNSFLEFALTMNVTLQRYIEKLSTIRRKSGNYFD